MVYDITIIVGDNSQQRYINKSKIIIHYPPSLPHNPHPYLYTYYK